MLRVEPENLETGFADRTTAPDTTGGRGVRLLTVLLATAAILAGLMPEARAQAQSCPPDSTSINLGGSIICECHDILGTSVLPGGTCPPSGITVSGCSDGNQIFQTCTGFDGTHELVFGSSDFLAAQREVEDSSIKVILMGHGFDPNDPVSRARLLQFSRDDVRAAVYAELTGLAEGAAMQKLSGDEVALEQQLVPWFQGLLWEKEIDAANAALDEYAKWAANPCSYMPPDGYFSGWNRTQACAGTPLSQLFSTTDEAPSADAFTAYGTDIAYGPNQDQAASDFTTSLTGTTIGIVFLSALPLLGATGVTAFAAGLALFSITSVATIFYSGAVVTVGLAAASAAGALLFGVPVVALLILVGVIAVLQTPSMSTFDTLNQRLMQAQAAPPSIVDFLGTSEGSFKLLSTFIQTTFPVPGPALSTDVPVHRCGQDPLWKIVGADSSLVTTELEYQTWAINPNNQTPTLFTQRASFADEWFSVRTQKTDGSWSPPEPQLGIEVYDTAGPTPIYRTVWRAGKQLAIVDLTSSSTGPVPSPSPSPVAQDSFELTQSGAVVQAQIDTDDQESCCGNGLLDPGEACDDGNQTSGDGCSSSCTIESGFVCDGAGPGSCTTTPCGNGVVDPGEDCDAGPANGKAGSCCDANCHALASGSSCDDGNACTSGDSCDGKGSCTPGNQISCPAIDQCHVAGVCNPSTGSCSTPAKANGTPCDDGDACTQSDTCQSGECIGADPVVCSTPQCHAPSVCDPTSGACDTGEPADCTIPVAKDSFLRYTPRNLNEGANVILAVRRNGQNRAVVGFELTDVDIASVQSAKLLVTIASNIENWGKGRDVEVHPLLDDFDEGNGKDLDLNADEQTRGSGSGVTFLCPKDANIANFATDCPQKERWNGGSFGPMSSAVKHTNSTSGEVSYDVTKDVQNGYHAWLIKKADERQPGRVDYFSREGASAVGDDSLAPRLELTY